MSLAKTAAATLQYIQQFQNESVGHTGSLSLAKKKVHNAKNLRNSTVPKTQERDNIEQSRYNSSRKVRSATRDSDKSKDAQKKLCTARLTMHNAQPKGTWYYKEERQKNKPAYGLSKSDHNTTFRDARY